MNNTNKVLIGAFLILFIGFLVSYNGNFITGKFSEEITGDFTKITGNYIYVDDHALSRVPEGDIGCNFYTSTAMFAYRGPWTNVGSGDCPKLFDGDETVDPDVNLDAYLGSRVAFKTELRFGIKNNKLEIDFSGDKIIEKIVVVPGAGVYLPSPKIQLLKGGSVVKEFSVAYGNMWDPVAHYNGEFNVDPAVEADSMILYYPNIQVYSTTWLDELIIYEKVPCDDPDGENYYTKSCGTGVTYDGTLYTSENPLCDSCNEEGRVSEVVCHATEGYLLTIPSARPSGYVCDNGAYVVESECVTKDDCGSCYSCRGGKCIKIFNCCDSDDDCDVDWICDLDINMCMPEVSGECNYADQTSCDDDTGCEWSGDATSGGCCPTGHYYDEKIVGEDKCRADVCLYFFPSACSTDASGRRIKDCGKILGDSKQVCISPFSGSTYGFWRDVIVY